MPSCRRRQPVFGFNCSTSLRSTAAVCVRVPATGARAVCVYTCTVCVCMPPPQRSHHRRLVTHDRVAVAADYGTTVFLPSVRTYVFVRRDSSEWLFIYFFFFIYFSFLLFPFTPIPFGPSKFLRARPCVSAVRAPSVVKY